MSLEMLLLSDVLSQATALYGIQMTTVSARLETESPSFLSPSPSTLTNQGQVIA